MAKQRGEGGMGMAVGNEVKKDAGTLGFLYAKPPGLDQVSRVVWCPVMSWRGVALACCSFAS
jgi:hypothetical protein